MNDKQHYAVNFIFPVVIRNAYSETPIIRRN